MSDCTESAAVQIQRLHQRIEQLEYWQSQAVRFLEVVGTTGIYYVDHKLADRLVEEARKHE